MFSRIRRGSPHAAANGRKHVNSTPAEQLAELRRALDRLEYLTAKAAGVLPEPAGSSPTGRKRASPGNSANTVVDASPRSGSTSSSGNKDDAAASTDKAKDDGKEQSAPKPAPLERSPSAAAADMRGNSNSSFIFMEKADELEMIELLRRTAETVVLSERRANQLLAEASDKRQQREVAKSKTSGGDNGEEVAGEDDDDIISEDAALPYLAVFELFCERNALANFVNIVTGVSFMQSDDAPQDADESAPPQQPGSKMHRLPPLSIATQAVQSVSILIQNVSRATSLYYLLSNNTVNDLIELPMHLYKRAELNALHTRYNERYSHRKNNKQPSPPPVSDWMNYQSSEMNELVTHFVSFLKSLAMRVNGETLQFFLGYAHESTNGGAEKTTPGGSSEAEGTLSGHDMLLEQCRGVNFPLYARALEFCSVEEDSFVRVTAMNICLNFMRLATVESSAAPDSSSSSPMHDDDENDDCGEVLPTSAPTGVLHDASTFPFRDRVAIAQYASTPSRVGDLVSPLCTRLTSQLGQIEGAVRSLEQLDSRSDESQPPASSGVSVKSKKKTGESKPEERKRIINSIQGLAANIQDELLLLDDLLDVGLVSLNEQSIEMLLATFVYPMLLQPLLLPLTRFASTKKQTGDENGESAVRKAVIDLQSPSPLKEDDEDEHDDVGVAGPCSNESTASNGSSTCAVNGETPLRSSRDMDTAPAKTALFGLSAILQTVSNGTFRHLLLTALLHPLAPEASNGAVISSRPQVVLRNCSSDSVEIRTETKQADQSRLNEPFQQNINVYTFGTSNQDKQWLVPSSSPSANSLELDTTCVFILAPSLVDMLRKYTCPGEDLKDLLSIQTKNSTRTNPYRKRLMSAIAGDDETVSLKSLAVAVLHAAVLSVDNLVLQKLFLETLNEDEARKTIQCVAKGLVHTSVTYDGWWKATFDTNAARALIDLVSSNSDHLTISHGIVDHIRMKSSQYLLTLPARLDSKSREAMKGAKSKPNMIDRQHLDSWLLDRFFFDQSDKSSISVVENMRCLKETPCEDSSMGQYRYGLEVLSKLTFNETRDILCESTHIVDNMIVTESKSATPFHCASSWALTSLYLDSISMKLLKLREVFDGKVGDAARQSCMSAESPGDSDRAYSIAQISSKLAIAMLDEESDTKSSDSRPSHGTIVGLVGKPAFPCVCEVSPSFVSLFTGRTCISNEGIQWQSLYLVVVGRYGIFAEPNSSGAGGKGRVITAFRLACLAVKKDTTSLANNKTPARRLLLAHASLDPNPPALFVAETRSKEPRNRDGLRFTRSRMDLWFEDANAANHACKILSGKVIKARAKRGGKIKAALL